MKKQFFVKITLLVAIVFGSVYFILSYFPNGYKDPFYKQFSSPASPSLIIGTSRVAIALQPKRIEKELKNTSFNFPIINYSFTVHHSPFGIAYTNSIKKKLKHSDNKNGLFIISVDPWSISEANNKDSLADERDFVNDIKFVNQQPNFQYFFKWYGSLYKLLMPAPSKKTFFLHDDGWQEIFIDTDSSETKTRTAFLLKEYRTKMKANKVATKRITALEDLITYLKQEGQVYLVRLPVSKQMRDLENEYLSSFDKIINDIIYRQKIPYFNYISNSENYTTIDGHHLTKTSGTRISWQIANDILSYKNQKNK